MWPAAGINRIFDEMLRVLPEANCVEPMCKRPRCGPNLEPRTISHSWLGGTSLSGRCVVGAGSR
jgi:hypothetical protein